MTIASVVLVLAAAGTCLAQPGELGGPPFDPNQVVERVRADRGMERRPEGTGSIGLDDGEFLIDTSRVMSPAHGVQYSPAVSFNGTSFLVVWADLRPGAQDYDIYGARVSPSGTVLDTGGIPISTVLGHQRNPAVSSDGTNWLVVWQDERSDPSLPGIYGARVSGTGAVLDPAGVSTAAYYQRHPAISFDGTNFLVVWDDVRNWPYYDIYGTRVSQGGGVLDPRGITISTAANDQSYPEASFDGTNFLVAWQDMRTGSYTDIYGARVSPAGTVLDTAGTPISTAVRSQGTPTVSFGGTNFLVAWSDNRNASTWDIYGARVTPSGTVLDPNGVAISTTDDRKHFPSVASDGTDFFVVWQDYRTHPDTSIFGARVSQTGIVLDSNGIRVISTETNPQHDAAASFDGTNYLVAWADYRHNSDSLDIYGARVSPAGIVLDPSGISISTAADSQWSPAVSFDGTNFVVVWQDKRSGSYLDIYGARVSPAGIVLDPTGFPISTWANRHLSPAVSFDGTNSLVVWSDNRNGSQAWDIYGARVSPGGVVLDPNSIPVSTASASQQYPAVSFDGTNSLVVWTDNRGSGYAVYGARVSPAGTVLDPTGFAISTGALYHRSPAVSFDGSNFLAVWSEDRASLYAYDIYGTRVTPAGTVLDPNGIPISTALNEQRSPAVAFDGTNSLVVWQDERSGYCVFDIYGARVSRAGAVLSEFPVTTQYGNQYSPDLCRGSEAMLLVYAGWTGEVQGRQYNTDRIWGRLDPLVGVEERAQPTAHGPRPTATIVHGILVLPQSLFPNPHSHACLLDAAGRQTLVLHPGPNDICHLSPGVYFVRQRAETGSWKVVVQR